MKRIKIEKMRGALYNSAVDMLREEFCGAPKELHDADEYHISGATHLSSEKLGECIAEAAEKSGIEAEHYYIIHLYDKCCILIVPYNFSAETSQNFLQELNLVAKQHGLLGSFEGTGELHFSCEFENNCLYSSYTLEKCAGLLKNSFFSIN